jgi:hypothetical protein
MTEITEFFAQGIRLCPRALAAVTDFRRMVALAAKQAVTERLDHISAALGVPLHANDICDHHNPPGVDENWNGHWLWAAAKVEIPSLGTGYFGVYWGGALQCDGADARITATLYTKTRPDRDKLLGLCRERGLRVANIDGNEVSIFEPAGDVDSPETLKVRLDGLIDQWLELFRAVGGIAGFHGGVVRQGDQSIHPEG